MSRYIGLDVHTQSCTAVVLDQKGKKRRQDVLDTDAGVLAAYIKGLKRPRELCFEEGSLSAWLYEILEPLADKLVVVQPSKSLGHKSDAHDAYKLAEQLRCRSFETPIYKAPRRFSELREAVKIHLTVQQDVVRTKNRLIKLCSARAITGVSTQLYDPKKRHEVLAQLPAHQAKRGRILGDELDRVTECYEDAKAWLHEVAMRCDPVRLLMTAPGIGVVRAAQIVAIVISPARFRTKRQFWSYCGLGIVMRSSADHERGPDGHWHWTTKPRTRGLNRNRHPVLKTAFKGAARNIGGMHGHPLNEHYRRMTVEGNTKPNLARLTIARRIAAAVLVMWKTNKEYDPEKHQPR